MTEGNLVLQLHGGEGRGGGREWRGREGGEGERKWLKCEGCLIVC